jgi:adenylosuccinate lyase
MRQFIEGLDIPDADKRRLAELTPAAYTGMASKLVDAIE